MHSSPCEAFSVVPFKAALKREPRTPKREIIVDSLFCAHGSLGTVTNEKVSSTFEEGRISRGTLKSH